RHRPRARPDEDAARRLRWGNQRGGQQRDHAAYERHQVLELRGSAGDWAGAGRDPRAGEGGQEPGVSSGDADCVDEGFEEWEMTGVGGSGVRGPVKMGLWRGLLSWW